MCNDNAGPIGWMENVSLETRVIHTCTTTMNANSEPDSLRNAEFNDDQRKRIELNRLKGKHTNYYSRKPVWYSMAKWGYTAKMLRRKAEEGASQSTSSHETNVNNKRPMVSSSSIRASSSQVVDNRHDGKGKGVEKEAGPSTATSSGDANKREVRPLRRDARLGKYFDYDLSKMVNSKGGFLVDDAEEASIEDLRTRERERERERAMQNLDPRKFFFLLLVCFLGHVLKKNLWFFFSRG